MMPEQSGMLIGEVAERVGVRTSAIRYYESVGLVRPTKRVGGRRFYEPVVFEQLALIRLAQDAGFSVREIRTLLHGFEEGTPPTARWQALVRRKIEEVNDRIERAERMRDLLDKLARCRCATLGECVQKRVAALAKMDHTFRS